MDSQEVKNRVEFLNSVCNEDTFRLERDCLMMEFIESIAERFDGMTGEQAREIRSLWHEVDAD